MGGASSKPPESHPQPRPLKSRFRCPTAKCLRSIQTNRRKTDLLIPTLPPVPDTVLPESSRSQDMIVLSCQLFRLKFLELSLTPLPLAAHIVSVSTSYQLCLQSRSRIWPHPTTSTSSTFILQSKPSVSLHLSPRSLQWPPPGLPASICPAVHSPNSNCRGLGTQKSDEAPRLLRTCQRLISPRDVQSARQASRPYKIVSLFPRLTSGPMS